MRRELVIRLAQWSVLTVRVDAEVAGPAPRVPRALVLGNRALVLGSRALVLG